MKWSIIALLFLGVVAATSAVLFVVSFQHATRSPQLDKPASVPQVTVLVAAADLSAQTVVRADMVESRRINPEQAPAGGFSDPIQVVGKFLVAPVGTGQAFTQDCFAAAGSGVNLAAALPKGMRAVSVSVVESKAIGSLIYPGGMVDVIAAFKGGEKESVSTTVLRGLMMLAVGERTITESDKPKTTQTAGDRHLTVTLLVTPEQAEQLKLVSEEGTISLALRNPMDNGVASTPGTSLSKISPMLAHLVRRPEENRPRAQLAVAAEQTRAVQESIKPQEPSKPQERATPPDAGRRPETRTWSVLILRGGEDETKTFTETDFKELQR